MSEQAWENSIDRAECPAMGINVAGGMGWRNPWEIRLLLDPSLIFGARRMNYDAQQPVIADLEARILTIRDSL